MRQALIILLSCIAPMAASAATIDDLAWLKGAWEFERNGRVVREEWMPPAGGTMLGMSRTVKAGKTVAHEFLLLRTNEQGDANYVASPSGQATTEFKLVNSDARSVVFENKAHDFPQRIGYELREDGALLAWIEGEGKDGKLKRIEFPYKRVE